MIPTARLFRYAVLILCLAFVLPALAETVPPAASANGKYQGLIQILHCPQDSAKYGNFNDYGHWGGGSWHGQQGKAGYWVYVYPTWYVWANTMPPIASANGKYGNLIQTITCPGDAAKYGEFHDYGYWGGGPWCGQQGKAGYWVWVKPSWYVWSRKN
ncbi:hypothetical protein DENIS_2044 [Desulfonema ishimotonii]|uniref:Uncharacterized protein n=1 Tax=Desulfonema ishimotonii TaxID=45657 RepID=A0A401FVW6_9BACT|nr:hypothetical protein [Desulfonema ishimotonii]GBC61084.1 hypothetical protein DENIS_2044 [Desulfonema ishimotonii]